MNAAETLATEDLLDGDGLVLGDALVGPEVDSDDERATVIDDLARLSQEALGLQFARGDELAVVARPSREVDRGTQQAPRDGDLPADRQREALVQHARGMVLGQDVVVVHLEVLLDRGELDRLCNGLGHGVAV